MLQAIKWSFALFVAVTSIARAQSPEPKTQDNVTGNVWWGFPTWNARLQNPQSLNNVLSDQYVNDAIRQQNAYWVVDGKDLGSGLSLAPVDEAARAHLKLPKGQGLIATSVAPQGPAAQAGVCQNDILLTLGDAPLGKPEDLGEQLKAAGDRTLGLVVLHHGAKKTLQVQPRINVTFGPVQPAPPEFWIGVSVSPIEPALRTHLKIPADQGLIATEVVAESPAAKAEFKVNDILLTMAGQPLRDQKNLVDLVQKNGEKTVAVDIVREGSRQTLQVTPQRRKNPSIRQAQVQFFGDINVLRPGALIQGQPSTVLLDYGPNNMLYLSDDYYDLSKANGVANLPQLQVKPLPDRLDGMAAEIKELRKTVEELGKLLRDRK